MLFRSVIRTVGFAWSVASVFVIPVLVLEEHSNNPIEVVRQSAEVIRKTWGEALAGYAGLQLGGFLVGFSLFVAIIASGVGAYMTSSAWPVAVYPTTMFSAPSMAREGIQRLRPPGRSAIVPC